MTRRSFFGLALLLLSAFPSPAKEKKREWEVGKIVSAEMKEIGTVGYPLFWATMYKMKYVWFYTVETGKIVYELLWPFDTPLNVTVKGEVKIAPGKNRTYYLIDDEGRENKLTVHRKTAREAPAK